MKFRKTLLLLSLHHATFPKGLESIGDGAFESTALASELLLPSSLKTLGANAFAYCEEALAWVYGANENNGYIPGQGDGLSEVLRKLSFPVYNPGVYRYDDFKKAVSELTEGDDDAWK